MATRIEIELTSRQDEGRTFTWRAAGARQPKGLAEASLFPEGSNVGDEFRVEAEMDLDGIRITSVLPAKGKEDRKPKAETLELIARDEGPLVTQVLADKGRGGRDRDRGGDRRGPRREGRGPRSDRERGGERSGRPEGENRERRDRGDQRRSSAPRTPAKPKLPPKPKPPRLRAGKAHRSELIDSLPEEQKAVAQELLRGGLQAVRTGLEKQNEQRKVEGQTAIDEGPILTLAEQLLAKVRVAEWRDRAEAALEQAETVDVRDLRTVVTAADGAAKDDDTRALAAQLRTALNERLDADQRAWVAEVVEMLDDDRVVRALHLSSRPPKAGAPLPPEVAMRLVEASNAAMSAETAPDRWTYILDALAHSPVRRQVVPVSLPANVTDDLKAAIARYGSRLPEIAQIFGIEPDPKAARADRARKRRPAAKPAGAKGEGAKGEGRRSRRPESQAQSDASAETGDAPVETETGPAPEGSTAAEAEAAPVEHTAAPDAPESLPTDAAPAPQETADQAGEVEAAPAAEEPPVEVAEAVEQAPTTDAPAPEIPAAEAVEAEQADDTPTAAEG